MTFSPADEDEDSRKNNPPTFRVTGSAAHNRLSPLIPGNWIDCSPRPHNNKIVQKNGNRPSSPAVGKGDSTASSKISSSSYTSQDPSYSSSSTQIPDFLWENAPRSETRPYRHRVKCYSHLPNGTELLDSKWVLARLSSYTNEKTRWSNDTTSDGGIPPLLTTHCFRGISGLTGIAEQLGLRRSSDSSRNKVDCCKNLYDLMDSPNACLPSSEETFSGAPNLWVIKDAGSNGAGGVWVLGHENWSTMIDPCKSPLVEEHRYVAQQYVWPPVLYDGRKCHVRVYGLLTSDGRALVHEQAFLHVANDPFSILEEEDGTHSREEGCCESFTSSVHITNCCANSHNPELFAGEICANLSSSTWETHSGGATCVPLADFAKSIHSAVAWLAEVTFPFLRGGQANNGFEYLGLDFILSHDSKGQPVAYLLEVNAPPSQDTATGLSHAEAVHDAVVGDLLSFWVLPKVLGVPEGLGGWHCVYRTEAKDRSADTTVPPSKGSLLNKMRWATFERKASRHFDAPQHSLVEDIRGWFPYYQDRPKVFLENAGGAQVPMQVMDAVSASLRNRHRSELGHRAKHAAKSTLYAILGASPEHYDLFLGSNATTLLSLLAQRYALSNFLQPGDEILVSAENHLANVTPWLEVAQRVGASVHWCQSSSPTAVEAMLTPKTRVVTISHASNVLGQVRDVGQVVRLVRRVTCARAHVVVDGVAVAPHRFVALDDLQADWYTVSCHKMFGTHLGVLFGRQEVIRKFCDIFSAHLELGTISYEACAGIEGVGRYFACIERLPKSRCLPLDLTVDSAPYGIERRTIEGAYAVILSLEETLAEMLKVTLKASPKVRIIEDAPHESTTRLPVYSFVHSEISSRAIVEACATQGVVCRNGTFLSSSQLQNCYDFCPKDGVVRLSVAHYNTPDEIRRLKVVLESIPGWT